MTLYVTVCHCMSLYVTAFSVPIANNLSDIINTRIILFISATLISSGLFLSSFATQVSTYFYTYGILCGNCYYLFMIFVYVYELHELFFKMCVINNTGLGSSLAIYPTQLLLNKYFERHRVLANGVMFSGSSLGTIVMPVIINYLIDEYSLRGMFLILSGISMHLAVAAALFRPLSYYDSTTSKKVSYTINLTCFDLSTRKFNSNYCFFAI